MDGWTIDVSARRACQCQDTAAVNPPDLAAIGLVFDELGELVAAGELARRLGHPIGAELVTSTLALADELASPTETGGFVDGAVRLAGMGGRALSGAAAKAWAKMAAHPELVSRLGSIAVRTGAVAGAYVAARAWLADDQAAALEDLRERRALVDRALQRVPPNELAATLVKLNPFGETGGPSWTTWLGLAALAAGLVLVWRWTR